MAKAIEIQPSTTEIIMRNTYIFALTVIIASSMTASLQAAEEKEIENRIFLEHCFLNYTETRKQLGKPLSMSETMNLDSEKEAMSSPYHSDWVQSPVMNFLRLEKPNISDKEDSECEESSDSDKSIASDEILDIEIMDDEDRKALKKLLHKEIFRDRIKTEKALKKLMITAKKKQHCKPPKLFSNASKWPKQKKFNVQQPIKRN